MVFFSVAAKIGDFFQCSSTIKLFSEIVITACGVRILLFLSCVDVTCNALSRAQCGDVIFSFFGQTPGCWRTLDVKQ